jgi:hypothetical protein
MIIAIGLVVLAAAIVIAVAGVLHNRGASHSLAHTFTVLGHHVNGSSGALFLYGIILGAVALTGLLLVLSGVRRTARRSRRTRRELKQAHLATAEITDDRDQLAQAQRQASPALNASRAQTDSEVPADLSNQHSFFEPMPTPPGTPAHRAS